MQVSIDDFSRVIRKCRSRETSWDPKNRSEENPSYRQCLFTTMLAHKEIWLEAYIEKVTLDSNQTGHHYFNKDGEHIHDFCAEQFTKEKILKKENERPISKERIEALLELDPEVKKRYGILRRRFQEEMLKNLDWKT